MVEFSEKGYDIGSSRFELLFGAIPFFFAFGSSYEHTGRSPPHKLTSLQLFSTTIPSHELCLPKIISRGLGSHLDYSLLLSGASLTSSLDRDLRAYLNLGFVLAGRQQANIQHTHLLRAGTQAKQQTLIYPMLAYGR